MVRFVHQAEVTEARTTQLLELLLEKVAAKCGGPHASSTQAHGVRLGLRRAVAGFDVDGSGVISMLEFLNFFGLEQTEFNKRTFQLMDTDKSGKTVRTEGVRAKDLLVAEGPEHARCFLDAQGRAMYVQARGRLRGACRGGRRAVPCGLALRPCAALVRLCTSRRIGACRTVVWMSAAAPFFFCHSAAVVAARTRAWSSARPESSRRPA